MKQKGDVRAVLITIGVVLYIIAVIKWWPLLFITMFIAGFVAWVWLGKQKTANHRTKDTYASTDGNESVAELTERVRKSDTIVLPQATEIAISSMEAPMFVKRQLRKLAAKYDGDLDRVASAPGTQEVYRRYIRSYRNQQIDRSLQDSQASRVTMDFGASEVVHESVQDLAAEVDPNVVYVNGKRMKFSDKANPFEL